MKCLGDKKYKLFYFIYMILAVSFHIGQNSWYMAGNGLKNFSEYIEQVLYREPALIRIILLLPLCLLVLSDMRYYFGEQFIIRQKSRKHIYLRMLFVCFWESLFFSAGFVCVSFCVGRIYGFQEIHMLEAGKLFLMTFVIFLCMLAITVSSVWIIQNRLVAVALVCLFGFYDTVAGYSRLHVCSALCFMCAVFLTAEKREFYSEKYKNDSV